MSAAPFVSETRFHIRYAETDAMGIVHHSQYIVYFEEGRSAYARQRGHPYSEFEREGFILAVVEVGVNYRNPARYEQFITVRTWISEMRSRTLTFNYEIVDEALDETLATGFTRHICLDLEGKPTRIPEKWLLWMTD